MAMRSLVHLQRLLFEVDKGFNLGLGSRISHISTVFEDSSTDGSANTTKPLDKDMRAQPTTSLLTGKKMVAASHIHVAARQGVPFFLLVCNRAEGSPQRVATADSSTEDARGNRPAPVPPIIASFVIAQSPCTA